MREWLIAAMFLLLPACLAARDKPCRSNPMVRGKSFVVHGRLSVYNGSPAARIWEIGTHRLLGISEGRFYREGYANLPESIKVRLDFETDLYGDFRVYPFTESKPGVMQLVCIEAVRSLVIRKTPKQDGAG
ncbi:MAG: hypothetical protein ABI870_09490 [Rhodanobacter sp.]